ncbi:ABC transporter permease [Caproicibacter sp. BJN0012]|uniref:ABC transporter permease n=1 Tax=Caproicibacter sp. BJN0012 TaxID=3110227 RepID=UPI002E15550E|nr:FtsX-like permease family protein [Caproicibacter sp. BJN0012]
MNVMSRFTLRSMRANRKWTVVTLIGIILSTAMLSAVSTFCASFTELMRNEAIADNGNWHAMVSGVRMRNVSAFEGAGFVDKTSLSRDVGYARLAGPKNEDKPYLFIRQFDKNSSQSFPVKLIEGRMPQNESELVLSEHLETNGGVKYKVGDKLTLETGKRVSPDGVSLGQSVPYQGEPGADSEGETFVPGQSRAYTVVGIMARPNFEPTWAPGYTALSFLDKRTLAPDDTVTVTLLAGKLGHGFFGDVSALAQSAGLDDSHVSYNTELLRYSGIFANDSAQNMIYGFAAVFIAIIIVASVSLIYNAFAISVSERVSQLGMLASVGATKRQKRRSIYLEGFLLGITGIPAGVLVGIAGIGVTLSVIRPLMESFTNLSAAEGLALHVSLLSIVAAVLLAALTIFISVWIPARRASKIMPIDAIRQSKEIRLTRKAVKTSRLTRTLFGFEGEIALKNLKRNRKKYRATVLSLIISLVLFLTVSYAAKEMNRASGAVETGYNFDLAVSYTNVPTAEAGAANAKIAALEGVTEAAAIEKTDGFLPLQSTQLSDLVRRLYTEGKTYSMGTTLYCLDDASFDRYVHSLGADPKEYRDTENPKMILINYGQAYFNGKRAAGELFSGKPGGRLLFSHDSSGKTGVELEVGLLTDRRPIGVLVSSLDSASAVVSHEVFDSLPDEMKSIDSRGNPSFQQLFLSCDDADALETKIQELLKGVSGRTYVFNVASQARSERNVMLVLGIFLYGFIILISLICIANIFNTVTTNVALRRREFAMLRSVGMTPKSFNRMIRFESVFYGLKALLWGLPISLAVTLLLHNLQADVFDVGFSLPWASYGVAVILIFVIVGVTMLYSSAKIKKENIIDALKTDAM